MELLLACDDSILRKAPPATKCFPIVQVCPQKGHKRVAFNFTSSHALEVRVLNLAIDGPEIVFFGPFNQMDESNLGCVAFCRLHAFAKKHVPNGHAIEPTNEFSITPSFERMGEA